MSTHNKCGMRMYDKSIVDEVLNKFLTFLNGREDTYLTAEGILGFVPVLVGISVVVFCCE